MSRSNEGNGLLIVGGIFLVILLIAVGAIVQGFTISVLWRWFVVSTFNAPDLSIPQAIGLALIIGQFTDKTQKEDKESEWYVPLLKLFLMPVFVLTFGWIVLQFI